MNNAIVVAIVWPVIVFGGLHRAIAQALPERINPETQADGNLESRFYYSILMLKDLNEKILALDHHLTSLDAHADIMQLANPSSYPEFQSLQDYVAADLKSKHALEIPDFLSENAVFTGAWTLVSLVLTDKSASDKTRALENVSCLLDFTMRMQNDINIIYYEMEFLRETNEALHEKCKALFTDHCRLIGYEHSLSDCREKDDWETVFSYLTTVFRGMQVQSQDASLSAKLHQERNHLHFRIDLTVQFIQEYTSMIAQGVKHYQKFRKILSKYEQETACLGTLPPAFSELQEGVQLTLEKFETAYRMPELFGSRLKMLMYGE